MTSYTMAVTTLAGTAVFPIPGFACWWIPSGGWPKRAAPTLLLNLPRLTAVIIACFTYSPASGPERLASGLSVVQAEYEFFIFNENPHSVREKGYRDLTPITLVILYSVCAPQPWVKSSLTS